ncbi:MAG: hypothetical protein IKY39_05690, partial [Clostridia bacterium]|nr:hypothetical protein [Clostridia bacterium]
MKTVSGYTWGRITLTGEVVGWIRLDFTDYGSTTEPDPE